MLSSFNNRTNLLFGVIALQLLLFDVAFREVIHIVLGELTVWMSVSLVLSIVAFGVGLMIILVGPATSYKIVSYGNIKDDWKILVIGILSIIFMRFLEDFSFFPKIISYFRVFKVKYVPIELETFILFVIYLFLKGLVIMMAVVYGQIGIEMKYGRDRAPYGGMVCSLFMLFICGIFDHWCEGVVMFAGLFLVGVFYELLQRDFIRTYILVVLLLFL